MSIAVITGSAGLIGSEAVRFFHAKGMDVVGIDNDMRRVFFGAGASTARSLERLQADMKNYRHENIDIRDVAAIEALFAGLGKAIKVVIHTAAQPSHDWAASDPHTDFTVNANGALALLEATRKHCPDAPFIHCSTNKVYGDTPNRLPLVEMETRWELASTHAYALHGIDEGMSIDNSMHSLFGVSKAASDLMVQEYGRYFGMKTACFRGGCLTGPNHSGAQLHGFLNYLVKCAVTGDAYTVFGYKGKQVRDNIHSFDLVNAFWRVFQKPRSAEIYNIGGSRHSNCSMIEAIRICEELTGRPMNWSYAESNRAGDHIWWISDVRRFQSHYPDWTYSYDIRSIIKEIHDAMAERSAI
ncbi:MAG: NAD-dependent epimerase [Rhodospirillales bacterium RIFCSPLOWO2_12_FULL_58_28]|nr:MAG: NAD-dependent epimerase [Rhodospirillales bacterium RIFCSPLOWO2_02_FULL_58_16]OHC77897.1 MAG: NAD-dependent epimerase [Rhodospirillales bacterium RIFCSPLOWO2_12_FULL_58_28]